MKKIEALIGPQSISQIRDLLEDRHISNFLFSNVTAKSGGGPRQHVYRGATYEVEFNDCVKLEAVVEDDRATDIAHAILRAAGGSRASCEAQVLIAPVNEIMFQPDEVGNDAWATGGQRAEAVLSASTSIINPSDRQRRWRPAFNLLAKMRRFLAPSASANPANESSFSARRTTVHSNSA
jgi:nitrogen regulatory protein PII